MRIPVMAASTFYDDPALFPPGSTRLDPARPGSTLPW
jgi:hypothetical protein